MSWGKLEDTFRDHWKPKRLAAELGVSRAEARGLIAGLWSWAISHAPDGDLCQLEDEEIEQAADWSGRAGAFIAAASSARVGLLDRTEHGFVIHEFFERSETRKATVRKAKQRARSRVNDPTIYVIERGDGPIKIGFTTDIKRRLSEYEQGKSRLVAFFSGTMTDESALHARFARWRLGKSEWFERSKEIEQWLREITHVSRDTEEPGHAGEERRGEEKEKRGSKIPAPSAPAADATGYQEAVAVWFECHRERKGDPPWGPVQGRQMKNILAKCKPGELPLLIRQFFSGPYPDTIRDGWPLSDGYACLAKRLEMLRADLANPDRRAGAAVLQTQIRRAERNASNDNELDKANKILAERMGKT